MKSEKGITLMSLLIYIAVLLTVMVVIGRITVFFTKNLDNVDSNNKASTEFSKINYCFLKETKIPKDGKKIEAAIGDMNEQNGTYSFPKSWTVATEDTKRKRDKVH